MTFETIKARNVHQAIPQALHMMDLHGMKRSSRGGYVLQVPFPVVTTYLQPTERVIFWDDRDANPFFHLYESLWMLSGRNDLASVERYVSRFKEYSDDGETLHGAYGYRWLKHFDISQLDIIANRLNNDAHDRRSVLTMWDPRTDLGNRGKDIPCNLVATFQRNHKGELDMTVFCRSNDIIWGAYGANAVHFSMLQEYLAVLIGCDVGHYHQISVNWHAYLDTFHKLRDMPRISRGCPYSSDHVRVVPMTSQSIVDLPYLMENIDNGIFDRIHRDPWSNVVITMMNIHWIWANKAAPERYTEALELIQQWKERHPFLNVDWIQAASIWISRRYFNWEIRIKNG